MVIYNARTQQKGITIFACIGVEFLIVLAFILGEFYNRLSNTIITLSIMIGTIAIFVMIYFLVSRLANSIFIFDKVGFIRKFNNRVVLTVKWEDVISIGTFRIYDFFRVEWGPRFLGIDFYDENRNVRYLEVAFSAKDAQRLKMSQLNKKLDCL